MSTRNPDAAGQQLDLVLDALADALAARVANRLREELAAMIREPASGDIDGVLSVEAAGAMLGLGRAASYSSVRSGAIPSLRLGRRLVVPRQALAALLAGRHQQAANER